MAIRWDNYVAENGSLVPGFAGIGGFRGRRAHELNRDEKTVVEYFFTNSDSNVCAVTDNFPSELWAMVMGQYARSDMTARERLLKLFRDLPKIDSSARTLEEVAQAIRNSGDISKLLGAHMRKAGKFIEEYGVDYGHASLRDSAPVRMCFEGVSQRATKFLEAAREGAYQEQSTRAVEFTPEMLGMPTELGVPTEIRETEFEKRFVDLGRELISFYREIFEASKKRLLRECTDLRSDADRELRGLTGNPDAKLSNRAWNQVVSEKAYDIARSLIPQNMTTSLGMTLCARRFQDMLTEWQSSEFEEMRILGRAAQIESSKIFPTLMKYGNASSFYESLPERGRRLSGEFVYDPDCTPYLGHREISSELLAHTPNIEDLVLASILLNDNESSCSLAELITKVSRLSDSSRREIARSQFDGKKSFEINPKTLEVGSFTFERVYDLGSYRDLQRQRGDRQQTAPYSTGLGFHMLEEISQLGSSFEDRFNRIMTKVRVFHDDLKDGGMHSVAQYVPTMAHIVDHVVTMDPGQLFYQAQLRCQAAGADTYRTIARQEMHQGLKLLPSFKGLVPFDDTPKYVLNRLPEAIVRESRNDKWKV